MTQELELTNISNHVWGHIPSFLDWDDDDPLWKQVDKSYAHGGGWRDFKGFNAVEQNGKWYLEYPGDPVFQEQARATRDDEILVIFPYSWVMWRKGDECKIARID